VENRSQNADSYQRHLSRRTISHLTTIRRKSVSSISEFTQDKLLIKGKHGFVFYQGPDEESKQEWLDKTRDFTQGHAADTAAAIEGGICR
jgi:hypothetical protein